MGIKIETHECQYCQHHKRLIDGSICLKKLMAITRDMHVAYEEEKGSCWVRKSVYVCHKVSNGKYCYRGFELTNLGYYSPDQCVWWEAIDLKTNCADFHAHSKRDLKIEIDEALQLEVSR